MAELAVDEIIIETLEADNLVLQNMSSSKYVQVSLLERMHRVTCFQKHYDIVKATCAHQTMS